LTYLSNEHLPALDQGSRAQQIFWGLSIAAACGALAALALRIAMRPEPWQWWIPLALAGGIAAADLGSGVVHWAADTWGRDDLPVIGRRLLVPFRVHHVNPDDLLRRSFIDTNGDVALVTIPVIAGLLMVPLDTAWGGPAAVSGLALCGFGMMTNQIHQWSHMPLPPRGVRWLQNSRVILGRAQHATHHARPYDAHYCITTGWCNRPLERLGFFRRLEAAITSLTGSHPRHDDERYEARYGLKA
jgi:ubiquitin-conjugating enzyme E2 variant